METLVPHVRIGGRYDLDSHLADDDGGCSVWRATDRILDRPVTIRVFLGDIGGLAVDPARAASHVTHPAVLAIYDLGVTAEGSFVVTEPEPGPSLAERMRSGPLAPRDAATLANDLIDACNAATAAGAPPPPVDDAHVWIDSGDRCKVGFGLLGPQGVGATDAEQVAAIGRVLYEALTGEEAGDDPRHPRSIDPRIGRNLDSVVMRALEPDEDGDEGSSFRDLDAFRSAMTRIAHAAPRPEPAPETAPHHSIFRSWMLVPLALVLITIAVIGGGLLLGKLELGGPLGVRAAPEPSPSKDPGRDGDRVAGANDVHELEIQQIRSYDPFGDGTEDASGVRSAIDESRSTTWQTENYFDAVMNKPGVGLLLDLGSGATVEKFRLATPTPGFTYEIRIGDEPRDLARDRRNTVYTAHRVDRTDLDTPAAGRYVLVWITSVVPDPSGGNRAAIADLTVLGPTS